MGIADFFSDLYSSMGFPEAHADAPPEDDDSKEDGGDADKSEGEGDEKAEGRDEEGGEAGGDEGGEEEPEEEEEEEPVDPKPKLEEGEFARAIHFQFRFASG
jgi:ubiquinol-cytochrome c reductase subunit 6